MVNSTPEWREFAADIKVLADGLIDYKTHLELKCKNITKNQQQESPNRSVGENATVKIIKRNIFGVNVMYKELDDAVKAAGLYQSVVFDETKHVDKPWVTMFRGIVTLIGSNCLLM